MTTPTNSGTIDLSQGKTYYETYGEEGEWVVCLHGITLWSFCYHNVVPSIASKGYRVLLFDFYGRGQSDAPVVIYNLDLFVSQTKEIMDHFKIQSADLIGFSMGGAVASTLTINYPDLVKKLILIAPAVVPVDVPFLAKVMTVPYLGRGLFNLLGKKAMLQKLRTEKLKDDFAHPDLVPEVIESTVKKLEWLLNERPGFFHAFHSTLYYVPLAQGMLQELPKISPKIKVYILWGDMDAMIPVDRGLALMDIFPNAKFERIAECGHSCVLEKPEETTHHLINFLQDTDLQSKL